MATVVHHDQHACLRECRRELAELRLALARVEALRASDQRIVAAALAEVEERRRRDLDDVAAAVLRALAGSTR